MLWTRAFEVSLWEAVLPEEVVRLPEELARVDALLGDRCSSPRSCRFSIRGWVGRPRRWRSTCG
jgi:hypothetical protein